MQQQRQETLNVLRRQQRAARGTGNSREPLDVKSLVAKRSVQFREQGLIIAVRVVHSRTVRIAFTPLLGNLGQTQ